MSVTVSSFKNFVGGEWVDSASGETIADVPRGTAEDVDRALQAAKKALPEWLETTPGERAEVLLKLADLIDEHAEELAQLESTNVGKPLPAARDEMPVSSDNLRYFAGPARAAGNVQVVKPSEQTPLTTLRFVQLAQEAEIIPPGVLNVITGDGVPVGEAIVKHPDVRLVSLTGDVETGKIIARTAADNLKRVHLELGGKAPVVVFDDADPAA